MICYVALSKIIHKKKLNNFSRRSKDTYKTFNPSLKAIKDKNNKTILIL